MHAVKYPYAVYYFVKIFYVHAVQFFGVISFLLLVEMLFSCMLFEICYPFLIKWHLSCFKKMEKKK